MYIYVYVYIIYIIIYIHFCSVRFEQSMCVYIPPVKYIYSMYIQSNIDFSFQF